MNEIYRRHWLAMGAEYGVVTRDGRQCEHVIDELVAHTPGVISTANAQLPAGFPQEVADSILGGLETAAGKLAG